MMTEIIEEIARLPGCALRASRGFVPIEIAEKLPPDLAAFYKECDGADLFLNQPFGFRLVSIHDFQPANRIIFGEDYYGLNRNELDSDITASWYLIAVGSGAEERLTIDLGESRRGYCYDSFYETHGTHDCVVIALSFTEMLQRIIEVRGTELYWRRPDAPHYGFAR